MGMPLDLIWLAVPAYVILQAIFLARSSEGSRAAVAVPLFFMVPVFAYTAFGIATGSNLWPLALLFSSPLALLWVIVAAMTTAGRQESATS